MGAAGKRKSEMQRAREDKDEEARRQRKKKPMLLTRGCRRTREGDGEAEHLGKFTERQSGDGEVDSE